jgi:hypothetical protein
VAVSDRGRYWSGSTRAAIAARREFFPLLINRRRLGSAARLSPSARTRLVGVGGIVRRAAGMLGRTGRGQGGEEGCRLYVFLFLEPKAPQRGQRLLDVACAVTFSVCRERERVT